MEAPEGHRAAPSSCWRAGEPGHPYARHPTRAQREERQRAAGSLQLFSSLQTRKHYPERMDTSLQAPLQHQFNLMGSKLLSSTTDRAEKLGGRLTPSPAAVPGTRSPRCFPSPSLCAHTHQCQKARFETAMSDAA